MSKKVIILVSVLFGCIVLGMFIFAYLHGVSGASETTDVITQ